MKDLGPNSQHVHGDHLTNSLPHGAVHTAVDPSVLFHFPDAQGIVDAFQGKAVAHVYGRSSSPTSSHLQQLLCRYHGALGAVTFSTGMAAISSTMFSLLRAGDHIVVSHFLFGNTRSFIQSLTGFGIAVSFVDITQCDEVKRAMQDNTRMVFCESLANPLTQIPDLAGIGKICQANGSLFMLDTTMTPHVMLDVTQYPVDLVITSLTKYIAGHGHAMGGAVLDMGRFDWSQYPHIEALYQVPDVTMRGLTQIRKKGLRDIGATLDPHAAGQILLGQETLAMRYAKAVNNAATIAAELASHDLIQHVYHPSLKSHPQSDLANEQFSAHGALLSFDLVADIDPVAFINRLSLILCATHLGDTRTLALPVTQTIFYEFSQAQRDAMGITDACVRLSIGIEEPEDLLADLRQALAFFA